MKKLTLFMLILLLLGGLVPLRAQNLTQMAREQIIKKVRLPAVASMLDSSWIRSAALDRMIMKFHIKPNGRVDVRSLDFQNASVEPINGLFIASLRRVKIPQELVPEGATVVVKVYLKFEFLNTYATRYITKYSVERVGEPRNLTKEDFYGRQSDGDYYQKQFHAEQTIYYDKYKLKVPSGPGRMPEFRVTVEK